MSTPTEQTYNELQKAYNFFNTQLFADELPPCLITLQRKNKTRGYFSPDRFVNGKGAMIDEIAINPQFYVINTIEESLSTLAHEMVHLQQHHAGTSGRRGYHNASWADKMEEIGLTPSTTAAPGGKRTGDRVYHFITAEGMFEIACAELITENFSLSWMDRFPPDEVLLSLQGLNPNHQPPTSTESTQDNIREGEEEPEGSIQGPTDSHEPPTNQETGPEPLAKKPALIDEDPSTANNNRERLDKARSLGVDVEGAENRTVKSKANRIKYSCPVCNTNVWGKPDLKICCGECSENNNPIAFLPQ